MFLRNYLHYCVSPIPPKTAKNLLINVSRSGCTPGFVGNQHAAHRLRHGPHIPIAPSRAAEGPINGRIGRGRGAKIRQLPVVGKGLRDYVEEFLQFTEVAM